MKIAIIGSGAMGEMHARAYENIAGVKVTYVYSRNPKKAEALARQIGADATNDLNAILSDATVEAVDVCVPSYTHHEFVIPSLNAGKHVFCETPLALSMEHAMTMMETAKKNKKLLLVGLLMRSVSEYQYVKEAIARGDLGETISAYAYRLGSYLRPDGFGAKEHYGDPTTELMTFDFDVMNWMFGKPESIQASGIAAARGMLGHVFASLQYKNAAAVVEASGVMPPSFPYSVGLRVAGEKIALEISTKFLTDGPPETVLTAYPAQGDAHIVEIDSADPYRAECEYFIDSVQGKADPSFLSVERAIEALQLSLATQESLKRLPM